MTKKWYNLLNTLKKGVFVLYRRCSVKKLATVSTLTVVLVACSSAVGYSDYYNINKNTQTNLSKEAAPSFIDAMIEYGNNKTMLEKIAAERAAAQLKEQRIKQQQFENKRHIAKRIKEIRKYANRTWYVFSGSTPRGWDCSGLVVWFYEGLGKEVPHSASKQGWMKPKVKDPKPGDVVVFRNKGYKNFNHSAIYIGNNKVIHAGFNKGDRTEIISLDSPAFDNAEIRFVRVLDVPLD
jgi:cell wall-associated NlpC family hydrolase